MAYCLTFTVLIEAGIAALCHVRNARGQRIVLLAQVATNPVVVVGTLILPAACPILEVWAIWLEALLYRRTGISEHPVRLSVLCNLASACMGPMVALAIAISWRWY